MKDLRQEWYDDAGKTAVVVVDVTSAARELSNHHLSGQTSAYYLAKSLAAVALLGAETSQELESVSLQLKCLGPLGGVYVECTANGELRGYTEKKILDKFDGDGVFDDEAVIGQSRIQVVRSVPGRILSRGIAESLEAYFAESLQRRVKTALSVKMDDQGDILYAGGIMVELLPDAPAGEVPTPPQYSGELDGKEMLFMLNLPQAELKRSMPLKFACRCSPERAIAAISALPEEERSQMPESVDVTCHMCGRTFTVKGSLR